MKTVFAILLSALLLASCCTAEPETSTESAPSPKPKAATASKASATTTTAPKPAAAKPTAAKTATPAKAARPAPRPVRPLKTEAEISGYAAETYDAYYARLSLTNTSPRTNWWIRTAYRSTTSRSYGRTTVTESNITGHDLDLYYRLKSNGSYRFASFESGNRRRTPSSAVYYDNTKFQRASVGYGRTIMPGVELETAITHISRIKEDTEDERFAPLYTLRVKQPIGSAVTMTADVHLVQPFSENALVDSRVNLTYKLTPSLSMRVAYAANNVLGTTLTKRDWDKLLRVSLVFSN